MDKEENPYQYMIFVALGNSEILVKRDIYIGNDVITIDLRSSLLSLFLRPHTQSGLVICRNVQDAGTSFDLVSYVIAIIRLGIDRVTE